MSQGSQGSFAADRIILPLSKFSYATVHGDSNIPIPWTHLGRPTSLFAVFESQRLEDSVGHPKIPKKFKVLQDPNVLEDIDLDALASEAVRAKAEVQDPRANSKLPRVAIIVKMPCIAIRYPLTGGEVRRIQIRLAKNEDYYEVLKIFSRANVPFGDAGEFPTQAAQSRQPSSSSSFLNPSDSTTRLDARPVSMSSRLSEVTGGRVDARSEWAAAPPALQSTMGSQAPTQSSSAMFSNYFGQPNQSLGPPRNSEPAFSDQQGLLPPTSKLVSGYFARQHQPPAFQHTPGSISNYISTPPNQIDLYQPRPLTAPIMNSQTLSQMLPPKRELPFSNTVPIKKTKKNSTEGGEPPLDAPALSARPLSPFPDSKKTDISVDADPATASAMITNPTATTPSTKKKRKVPARTPKRKGSTKRPVVKSTKRGSRDTQDSNLLTGVDQLLRETDGTVKDASKAVHTIDTQALLLRAEATIRDKKIDPLKLSQRKDGISNSSPPSSQSHKCNNCRLRKGKCNGNAPCDWCNDLDLDCTYDGSAPEDSNVLVPSSQQEIAAELPRHVTSTVEDNTGASPQEDTFKGMVTRSQNTAKRASLSTDKAPPVVRSRESNPPRTPPAQGTDHPSTLMSNATPASKALTAAPIPISLGSSSDIDPLHLLARDPAFARCNDLPSWATLPQATRDDTLAAWMARQMETPAFLVLVKQMEALM